MSRHSLQRTFLLLVLSGLFGSGLYGQMLDPVEWSFQKEKLEKGLYELRFEADLDEGWHLYSQNLAEDATPLPTVFEFEENSNISFKSPVQEHGVVKEPDPVSGNELKFFKKKGEFTRRVEVKGGTELKGSVEFMVCDDSRCLPPKTKEFSFRFEADPEKSPDKKGVSAGKAMQAPSPDGKDTSRKKTEDETSEGGAQGTEKPGMADPVELRSKVLELDSNRSILRVEVRIDDGWHIYGTELESGDGPIATSLEILTEKGQETLGKLWKQKPETKYDEQYERDLDLYEERAVFEQVIVRNDDASKSLEAELKYMACTDQRCLIPKTETLEFDLEEALEEEPELVDPEKLPDTEKAAEQKEKEERRGLLLTFFLSFAGGLAALLTPCVFPMIPLTVSFFTKQSPTRAKGIRNAITYAASIVLIYTALGYVVTLILGPDAMNVISTDPWMNIFFFAVILFFAISFLGGFDLNLPESWIDRSDKMADKGGLIGIFFMAFVLTLVSFSCTAPIIGPLLVQTASQGGVAPVVGMGGFSLALALPFGLFAGFPAWLNSLPQSGGWMNTVKVTLGFLELALAFKFLSNADLVTQAGLLKRELFLAIWIGIFGVMSFYLLGFFRTPNDDEVPRLSVPRLLIATASLIFTLYLIPGLFGAPVKLISGFPPPQFYSEWKSTGPGANFGTAGSGGDKSEGEGSASGHGQCPLDLNCFHDYEKALAHAKEVGKPLLLDFTGWACVNCRKMEENVWAEPPVRKKLSNDVVLASLYVDERSELPKEEQKTVKLNGEEKEITTVGNKWSTFQTKRFNTNTQPYYVLLDHEENELVEPTGYEPNVADFRNWLQKGIERFEEER